MDDDGRARESGREVCRVRPVGERACVRRRFFAFALLLMAAFPAGSTASARSSQASYANAAIADRALTYVGQWGGNACRDAHRSGLTGSTTVYPVKASKVRSDGTIDPNFGGDGQCRAFVNCIVWMVSSHTQWLGGTYFGSFLQAGAKEIKSVNELVKGDIVQSGDGVHTYVIVKRLKGNVFNVVDSNHDYKETVLNYNRAVTLNANNRAFRLGATSATGATQSGVIAFIRNTGKGTAIYSVKPDGTRLTRLTPPDPPGQAIANDDLAWSPDGKTLAFDRCRVNKFGVCAAWSIWTMNADGTSLRKIVGWCADFHVGFCPFNPTYSPDGRTIAVESQNSLWLMNADGSNPRRIFHPLPPTSRDTASLDFPAFSPAANWIEYRYVVEEPTPVNHPTREGYALRMVRPDGTGDHEVTPYQVGQLDGPAAWSPDGRSLVFGRTHFNLTNGTYGKGATYTVDVATKKLRLLTDAPVDDASFSPDGKSVVLSYYVRSTIHIGVMSASGGSVRQITNPPGQQRDAGPVWQPSMR